MNKFICIVLASLLLSFSAHSMEAPKRANDYLENTTAKKSRTEPLLPSISPAITAYLCTARSNNGPCHKEFNTQGLLKRHLRETHGFSPQHIQRYSMSVNHCCPEFK